ncbi:MAG: YiiX family permuted papain-like enzyme [Moraxellaceae bacterium]|nr:YiiX family permuted papain-like enzyme [Moraxellaceae bacterium]
MKRITILIVGLLFSSLALAYEPKAGDIVFHTSLSQQSIAVQAATNSPYSHMGIVLYKDSKPYVFEAVQPVKYTPLDAWLNRGKGKHYVVKRLKSPLSALAITRLQEDAAHYVGKPYDLSFEWSDSRIYCSELVWKLYKSATDIELTPLAELGSFNLTNPAVKATLIERYGSQVPLNEPVVAPVAIFESPLLVTVAQR